MVALNDVCGDNLENLDSVICNFFFSLFSLNKFRDDKDYWLKGLSWFDKNNQIHYARNMNI